MNIISIRADHDDRVLLSVAARPRESTGRVNRKTARWLMYVYHNTSGFLGRAVVLGGSMWLRRSQALSDSHLVPYKCFHLMGLVASDDGGISESRDRFQETSCRGHDEGRDRGGAHRFVDETDSLRLSVVANGGGKCGSGRKFETRGRWSSCTGGAETMEIEIPELRGTSTGGLENTLSVGIFDGKHIFRVNSFASCITEFSYR